MDPGGASSFLWPAKERNQRKAGPCGSPRGRLVTARLRLCGRARLAAIAVRRYLGLHDGLPLIPSFPRRREPSGVDVERAMSDQSSWSTRGLHQRRPGAGRDPSSSPEKARQIGPRPAPGRPSGRPSNDTGFPPARERHRALFKDRQASRSRRFREGGNPVAWMPNVQSVTSRRGARAVSTTVVPAQAETQVRGSRKQGRLGPGLRRSDGAETEQRTVFPNARERHRALFEDRQAYRSRRSREGGEPSGVGVFLQQGTRVVEQRTLSTTVVPAQAGTQVRRSRKQSRFGPGFRRGDDRATTLGSRLRGNDGNPGRYPQEGRATLLRDGCKPSPSARAQPSRHQPPSEAADSRGTTVGVLGATCLSVASCRAAAVVARESGTPRRSRGAAAGDPPSLVTFLAGQESNWPRQGTEALDLQGGANAYPPPKALTNPTLATIRLPKIDTALRSFCNAVACSVTTLR